MKIRVEQQDIDFGIPRSPGGCAIAQAIRRTVPCQCIAVLHSEMWIENFDQTLWFRVKEPMGNLVDSFIKDFDSGLAVRPIEFELELTLSWSNGSNPTGFTTALKLLQILAEKVLVERAESQRSQIYKPAVSATADAAVRLAMGNRHCRRRCCACHVPSGLHIQERAGRTLRRSRSVPGKTQRATLPHWKQRRPLKEILT